MHTVCANCALNISAAHAADADGGCFSERPGGTAHGSYAQRNMPPLEAALPLPPNLSIEKSSSKSKFEGGSMQPFHDFALNSRGWVFQERLLAPRTVYYDKNDVYWECYEKVASGSLPMGIMLADDLAYMPSILRPPFDWRNYPKSGDGAYPTINDRRHWTNLARSYSKRKLTRAEDRLIAFLSVSYKLCEWWGDEYIAGYCRALLPRALLWYNKNVDNCNFDSLPSYMNRGHAPFVAPSWSWGCSEEDVGFCSTTDFDECPIAICARISRTKVRLVDESNKFGPINFASITIRAPVFFARLDEIVQGADGHWPHLKSGTLHVKATYDGHSVKYPDDDCDELRFYPDKHFNYTQPESFQDLVYLVILKPMRHQFCVIALRPLLSQAAKKGAKRAKEEREAEDWEAEEEKEVEKEKREEEERKAAEEKIREEEEKIEEKWKAYKEKEVEEAMKVEEKGIEETQYYRVGYFSLKLGSNCTWSLVDNITSVTII